MSTPKPRTASYLLAEIEKLKNEYAEVVERERDSVIERIVDSMRAYDITVSEISSAMRGTHIVRPEAPAVKVAGKRPIKYRDDKGNTWSGQARVPGWIVQHEKAGGSREDFRVKEAA